MADIKYSDFSLSFIAHPNSGDINTIKNEDSVKQAVINLILTGYNERRFYPNKGCGIYFLLFEQMSFQASQAIEEYIRAVLNNWEPRVNVLQVACTPDYNHNGYNVTIQYELINSLTIQTIDFFLELIK